MEVPMGAIQFWKDRESRTILPGLFSDQAEGLAKDLASDANQGKDVNKRTQLRKFYDEVLRLNTEAKRAEGNWDDILPLVNMVVAKAAYAKGRNKVSEGFLGFIRDSVKQVRDPQDLDVFANFFEAFMGFYRLHGPN
jgi:CRISPR-associated protein Csm2